MNIMYLLYSFTVGGTERLVTDICNEMASREHTVHLYIINDRYSNDLIHMIDKRVHVVLQNRKAGKGEKIGTIIKITDYIIRNHIEVVHCNAFYTPELLFFKPFLFRKVRVIHTIHGIGQYRKLNPLRVKLRNFLCDKLIAISSSVKTDILSCGADARKTEIVYNAINLERFQRKKEKQYKDIIIGNVARMDPEIKGQDILIEAVLQMADKYPNIKCFFAGGFDQKHRKAIQILQEKVEKNGLSQRVFFLGNVDDIPGFLEQLDLFVLPSRLEGFGISLIEAMSMGIPCIASDLAGPAEIIGDEERGFLFPVGDAGALADKIMYVIEHYGEIRKRQAEMIQYVHSMFDIKDMCDRLIRIYIEG